MAIDKHKTDVVFRIDKQSGDVYALMPHEVSDRNGNVTTYQHVGQHSTADYGYCIRRSKKATPKQYKDLLKELTNIGYNVNVVERQNYNKWLKDYNKRTKLLGS